MPNNFDANAFLDSSGFSSTEPSTSDTGPNIEPVESTHQRFDANQFLDELKLSDSYEPPAKTLGGELMSTELGKGVMTGGNQLQALVGGLAGIAGDLMGNDGVRDWGLGQYQSQMREAEHYKGKVTTYKDVDSFGEAVDYALYGLGTVIPMLVPSIASGGIGAIAAKKAAQKGVEKYIQVEVAKQVAKGVAEKEALKIAAKKATETLAKRQAVGAAAGASAASMGMESGYIYGEVYDETGETRPGVALSFGAVAGALDALPVMTLLKKMGVGQAAKEQITKEISENLSTAIGKQILQEGGTEAAQTIIERAAVKWVDENKDIFDEEGWQEIVDSALIGSIAGGAMGAAFHPFQGASSPDSVESELSGKPKTAQEQLDEIESQLDRMLALPAPQSRYGNDQVTFADGSAATVAEVERAISELTDKGDTVGAARLKRFLATGNNARADIDGTGLDVISLPYQNEQNMVSRGPLMIEQDDIIKVPPESQDQVSGNANTGMDGLPVKAGRMDSEPQSLQTLKDRLQDKSELQTYEAINGEPVDSLPEPKAIKERVTQAQAQGLTPRFASDEHRAAVKSLSNELTKGGGVEYIRDENDRITGRTKSLNPDWFQSDENMASVKYVQDTVDKALAGGKLGKKQASVIERMMDEYESHLDDIGEYGYFDPADDNAWFDSDGSFQYRPADSDYASTFSELEVEARDSGVTEQELMAIARKGLPLKQHAEALYEAARAAKFRPNTDAVGQADSQRQAENNAAAGEQAERTQAQPNERPDSDNQRPEPEGLTEDPILSSYSEEDIQAKVERESDAEAVAEAEKKSQVDRERESFALEGSPEGGVSVGASNDALQKPQGKDLFSYSSSDSAKSDSQATLPVRSEKQADDIDAAAHEAATSPLNNLPEPTEAQAEAGNYKKGRIEVQGIKIAIENPKGSVRKGTDSDGKQWESKIHHHYGDLSGTKGADGDPVDVFVGDDTESQKVFIIDQIDQKTGRFDEHKVMLAFGNKLKAIAAYKKNYEQGWKVGPVTEMSADELKEWMRGDTTQPLSDKLHSPAIEQKEVPANSPGDNSGPSPEIEDFGEELKGAKKHYAASVRERLSDMDDAAIASSTLSKLWPKSEIDSIEDQKVAALYRAMRDEIPSKPRQSYKLKRWVESVKAVRSLVDLAEEGGADALLAKMRESGSGLAAFADRVDLLSAIDRPQWDRIGRIRSASGSYRDASGEMVPGSWYDVEIDGRFKTFYGIEAVSEIVGDLNSSLDTKAPSAKKLKMAIYSRGRNSGAFIAADSDKEKRPLKEFDSLSEARSFLNEPSNQAELESAWEKIKERDNVSRTDVRNKSNRERKGKDYRDGEDITPEQFSETFGFRGVQFGNWVKQGGNGRERQGMLNQAYDALLDLADIVDIPPKAISLNGELGLAFGARGKGSASAHYEPGQIVINLTKTKGAGSLAHEWFHALDHYFQRKRGTGRNDPHGGEYITFQPETYYQDQRSGLQFPAVDFEAMRDGGDSRRGMRMTKAQLDRGDWKKIEGVRPEVANAFAALVDALNESPMRSRARTIDAGKKDGYWSRIIERAARSFESYVIAKMSESGLQNDYLANVTKIESYKRNPDRYPYLLDEEMESVANAFDRLFETIETKKTDSGVALFSIGDSFGVGPLSPDFSEASSYRDNLAKAMKSLVSRDRMKPIKLGRMPPVLRAVDAPEKDLYIRKDTVLKAINKAKEDHDVPMSVIENLPELLADPIAVFDDVVKGDFDPAKVVLVDAKTEAGKPVSVAIHMNVRDGRLEINRIASVHGRLGYSRMTPRYFNNEKSPDLIRLIRSQLPLSGSPNQGSRISSVLTPKDIVNNQSLLSLGNNDGITRNDKAGPIGTEEARKIALNIINGEWRDGHLRGDSLVVLDSFDDLPAVIRNQAEEQDASGKVEGVFHGGKIYLVANELKSASDVERVLFHEAYGHYGFSNLFGKDIRQRMNQLYLAIGGSKGVAGIAGKHNIKLTGYVKGLKDPLEIGRLSTDERNSIIMEELLAHIQQENNQSWGRRVQEIIGAIRQWLRQHGLLKTAKLSDSELMHLLKEAKNSVIENTSGTRFVVNQPESKEIRRQSLPLDAQSKIFDLLRSLGVSDEEIQARMSQSFEKSSASLFSLGENENSSYDDLFESLGNKDKTIWERAKKALKRELTPGGLLPKHVFQAKLERDFQVNGFEFDIANRLGHLEEAVRGVYGKSYAAIPEAEQIKLNDALGGEGVDGFDPRIREEIYKMRLVVKDLSAKYASHLAAEIEALEANGSAEAESKARLLETIQSNMDTYVHRSYRAFDDPSWPRKVSREIYNDAVAYLENQYSQGGEVTDAIRKKVRQTVELMLEEGTAFDSMEAFIKESKLGAKDLSVLQKRKQIAPEIRALLGEYRDAKINFSKSVTKMARLVMNQSFLDRVKEIGLSEGFLFTEADRPIDATRKIAADASEAYAPLNGYYTYPEIDQAFRDALGKEQMADWFRMVVRLNGMVKYGKTVLSPTTAFRNWMSAAFFAMANGHFDFRQMKKSVESVKEYFTHGEGRDGYLRKLKELGVIYDTPYAGEMMDLLADSQLEDSLFNKKPFTSIRKANEFAQKFYQYGDDFWKIIGFENEKAGLIKHAGMPESLAEAEAAERIRNTYPTYSMTGRFVQRLRRFPLAGTFVSFPAEIIRTSYHILRYLKKDMREHPGLARRKVVGLALTSGMIHALQAVTMAMVGIDDDDDEAFRDLAPEWQRNSNLLFLGRNEKGQLRLIDMSFLDPYNYWKRPINAIMRDQPVDEALKDSAREAFQPFFGQDIAFGAIMEAVNNKKASGGRVFNPGAPAFDQAQDIADHLRKSLQPGIASNVERIYRAANNEVSSSGRPYDLKDEAAALAGFRVTTFDPKASIYYRSFEFQDKKRDAYTILSAVARSPNKVSDDDIRKAYRLSLEVRGRAYEDMIQLVNAALNSGLTKPQVASALRNSGVSKEDVRYLLSGKLPPWKPSPTMMRNAVKKAAVLFDPETAKEFQRRQGVIMREAMGSRQR